MSRQRPAMYRTLAQHAASQSPPTTTAGWCPPVPPAPPEQDRRQLMMNCLAGSLAQLKWRPLLLTGLLRQLLIAHFASTDNIEDPDLKDPVHAAIWRDSEETGILIETVQRWRGDLVQKRPAVLINRNAYKNMRLTISDVNGPSRQGFLNYVTMWVGSHSLFAISGSGAGCEILATEVQRELTQFGPVILQQLGLHKFQVTEVGEVSEVEESAQNFAAPITIGWAYEETWQIEPEALPLAGVVLEVNIDDI